MHSLPSRRHCIGAAEAIVSRSVTVLAARARATTLPTSSDRRDPGIDAYGRRVGSVGRANCRCHC
jgi:hypothetical protein